MHSNVELLSSSGNPISVNTNESYGIRSSHIGPAIGESGANTKHELQPSNECRMDTNSAYGIVDSNTSPGGGQ